MTNRDVIFEPRARDPADSADVPALPSRIERLIAALSEIWQDLLAILWPVACACCGAPDRQVCAACLSLLRTGSPRAQRVDTAAGPAWSAGPYTGPRRALLVAYKHAGATRFATVLGECLVAPLQQALREAPHQTLEENSGEVPGEALERLRCDPPRDIRGEVLVVAVPSRASRVRERGYRHVDLLVRAALRRGRSARPSGRLPTMRLLPGALRALPGRRSQVGLRSAERERNAALVAVPRLRRRRLRGRRVLLVDDVITTGATVSAAVRSLEAAGANVVGIAVLCAAERRDARR